MRAKMLRRQAEYCKHIIEDVTFQAVLLTAFQNSSSDFAQKLQLSNVDGQPFSTWDYDTFLVQAQTQGHVLHDPTVVPATAASLAYTNDESIQSNRLI